MAPKRSAALEAMIEEHLVVQFPTTIDLLDLPLPTPPPDGTVWIDDYRHWAGR